MICGDLKFRFQIIFTQYFKVIALLFHNQTGDMKILLPIKIYFIDYDIVSVGFCVCVCDGSVFLYAPHPWNHLKLSTYPWNSKSRCGCFLVQVIFCLSYFFLKVVKRE